MVTNLDSRTTCTISPDKSQSSYTEPNAEASTQFIRMSKGSIHNKDLGSSHNASPDKTISSSTKLSTGTSTAETIPMSKVNQEPVILMDRIGVVEDTIIIVGILAVRRFRQLRKSTMKRRSKDANDRRPVSRKTVFGIDNVYDTIPFDDSDENPYKDLSEGVYDTTSKRRSHVNGQRSNFPGEVSFYICFINQTSTKESQ